MHTSDRKQRNSLGSLVKFLLNENIDNSMKIIDLQILIHKNLKMKKKDRKKLTKKINKSIDKVNINIRLLREIHKNEN